MEKKLPEQNSLWDSMALAFEMFGRAFSVSESLFPTDVCQCTLEVLRKVMDVLASKGLLVEDRFMWRFYSCLLDCVHEVLTNIKCPVSDHVSSFIAALRMFFCFGLTGPPQFSHSDVVHKDKQLNVMLSTLISGVSKNAKNNPYRPPHLRKRDVLNTKQPVSCDWRHLSAHDSGSCDVISSDSDFSDSDGSVRDSYCAQSSKVRIAAIVCIQDLCQADSKSFTTQWMDLFPTSDVLKPRKFEATLMTCLLFDPHLKPIKDSGGLFGSWLGSLSNDLNILPINYIDWRKVPNYRKEMVWKLNELSLLFRVLRKKLGSMCVYHLLLLFF
ncbi:unnamed protein product [Arabidopsis lyrata]|nr:unnamed protein product [Arabidopsis lyrata]